MSEPHDIHPGVPCRVPGCPGPAARLSHDRGADAVKAAISKLTCWRGEEHTVLLEDHELDRALSVPAPTLPRPSATWHPESRRVIAELAPIVDGLCSGCGTNPSRETGSCRCLFRVDEAIRPAAPTEEERQHEQ